MIAAIYETVIRPELYDAFMEEWHAHIGRALEPYEGNPDVIAEGIEIDPELGAHFARAYEILETMGRKTSEAGLADRIRLMPGFALLVGENGRVQERSKTAASLPMGQVDDWEGLATHLASPSAAILKGLIVALRAGESDATPVVLSTGAQPRHLLARLHDGGGSGQHRGLFLEALEYEWSPEAEQVLVHSFGLTRAELDIVRNLLAGRSLKEIAETTHKSEHTIRNQAKAVLAKTGAPGQVDLIRLVVFLINQGGDGARSAPQSGLSEHFDRMGTGLGLQWFEFGPEDGKPLVFLHGMLDGMAVLDVHRARFEKSGYRVIAPVRPGYGRSEKVARPEDGVELFCSHVEELIGRLKLNKPVLFGHMGGGMYTHVLARRLGRQVAGALIVSSGPPIRRLAQFRKMAPRQQVVAYTARFARGLLPAVLRAGIAQIDGRDIKGFMTALYQPGTHDHALLSRLGLAERLKQGYRFSVLQGHAGFAMDSYYVVRDWSALAHGQAERVVYLNGDLDPVNPGQDMAAGLADMPRTEARALPYAGQLLFYEHPDIVFDALESMVAAK